MGPSPAVAAAGLGDLAGMPRALDGEPISPDAEVRAWTAFAASCRAELGDGKPEGATTRVASSLRSDAQGRADHGVDDRDREQGDPISTFGSATRRLLESAIVMAERRAAEGEARLLSAAEAG